MSDNPYIRLHGSDNRAAARGWDEGYAAGFGFAAGRAAATPDPPPLLPVAAYEAWLANRAASPDERLREPADAFCDRLIDEIIVKLGGERGFTSDRFPLTRWEMKACLLAAADREKPRLVWSVDEARFVPAADRDKPEENR